MVTIPLVFFRPRCRWTLLFFFGLPVISLDLLPFLALLCLNLVFFLLLLYCLPHLLQGGPTLFCCVLFRVFLCFFCVSVFSFVFIMSALHRFSIRAHVFRKLMHRFLLFNRSAWIRVDCDSLFFVRCPYIRYGCGTVVLWPFIQFAVTKQPALLRYQHSVTTFLMLGVGWKGGLYIDTDTSAVSFSVEQNLFGATLGKFRHRIRYRYR